MKAMPLCCNNQTVKKIFTAPTSHVKPACEYWCPVTKSHISTWKKRNESFAKHDLIDANDFGPADHGDKARIDKEFENTPGVVMFGDDKDYEKKINELGVKNDSR
ncbi:MAG: hypothetical protein L3J83_03725 [Proteobacteria bacterium]|nr:hypothetical protein [Pseudomonadota bacterium]